MAKRTEAEVTNLEEANDPRISHAQFKPFDNKNATASQGAEQADRIVDAVNRATPSERRAGARFYDRAHRDAVRVGLGMNPGQQPYDSASARPGRTRLSKATPEQQSSFHDPKTRQAAAVRGAGAIAATSPSSPAGMDWEHNPTAAYEVGTQLSEHAMEDFRTAHAALHETQKIGGELKSARNRGQATDEFKSRYDNARSRYAATSETARAHLEGMAANHAGGGSIVRARQILSGEKTPEEVLPRDQKTGHFYRNMANPRNANAVTIDGRSHDIAMGTHLPWEANRGLGAKGRYEHFADAHRAAAAQLGMLPHQVQATSWLVDKREMSAGVSEGNKKLGRGAHRNGEA